MQQLQGLAQKASMQHVTSLSLPLLLVTAPASHVDTSILCSERSGCCKSYSSVCTRYNIDFALQMSSSLTPCHAQQQLANKRQPVDRVWNLDSTEG